MNSKNDLTIIVMGLDADGKPRAGAYPTDMASTAAKDAAVWKLRVGRAENDAAKMLAKDLPSGPMFPSNKMQLPIIKRETYDLLLKTVKCEPEPAPMPKQETKPATPNANPWDAIAVGSMVLAQVDKEEGYFPARVEKISADGKTLTLKWKDYPKLPVFNMRRLSVGLLAVVK